MGLFDDLSLSFDQSSYAPAQDPTIYTAVPTTGPASTPFIPTDWQSYSSTNPFDLTGYDYNTAPQALPLTQAQSDATGFPIVNWSQSVFQSFVQNTPLASGGTLTATTSYVPPVQTDNWLTALTASVLPKSIVGVTQPLTNGIPTLNPATIQVPVPMTTASSPQALPLTPQQSLDTGLPVVNWNVALASPTSFLGAVGQSLSNSFKSFERVIAGTSTKSTPFKTTNYGTADDKTPDSNTKAGVGNAANPLTPNAVALTSTMAQQLQAKPGDVLKLTDTQGQTHYVYYGDTAPESDARIDLYNPNGTEANQPYTVVTAANLGGASTAPSTFPITINPAGASKLSTAGINLSRNAESNIARLASF